MNFFDYCYLSLIDIKRDKRNFLKNIMLIAFSLSILIISSIATESINDVLNRNIKYNLSHRSIYVKNPELVSQETFINDIENVAHISRVVTQDEYEVSVDTQSIGGQKILAELSLIGSDNNIYPPLVAGRQINVDERNVCIVPKNFRLKSLNDSSENIIDGESLLNKEIEIVYYNYDYSGEYPTRTNTIIEKYIVVGVYDQDLNMGEFNECYINFDDVLKIQNEILKNSHYDNGYSPVIAIVDNAENVNDVLDDLDKLGYESHLRSTVNTKLIDMVETICTILSIGIMIVALSNIVINSIKTAEEKKEELGLLKALGFNDRILWKIIIIESIITAIISFVLSCIFALLLVIILYAIIKNSKTELQRINLIINYNIFNIIFFITLLIEILMNIIINYNVIKKATIIKNMKN